MTESELRQTYRWLFQRIALALIWNIRFAALVAMVAILSLLKRFRLSMRPSIVRAVLFIDASRMLGGQHVADHNPAGQQPSGTVVSVSFLSLPDRN